MLGGMPPQVTASSANLVGPGMTSVVESTAVGSTMGLAWSSHGRTAVARQLRRRTGVVDSCCWPARRPGAGGLMAAYLTAARLTPA